MSEQTTFEWTTMQWAEWFQTSEGDSETAGISGDYRDIIAAKLRKLAEIEEAIEEAKQMRGGEDRPEQPEQLKPYSRIPIRDVPVGRLFVYNDRVYKKPSNRGWSWRGYSVISECGKSHSYIGDSIVVTILPEQPKPSVIRGRCYANACVLDDTSHSPTISVHGSHPIVIPEWARNVQVKSVAQGYDTTTTIEIRGGDATQ